MKLHLFIYLALLSSVNSMAQIETSYCTYYGDAVSSQLLNNPIPVRSEDSFASNQEALDVIDKILRPTGLKRNFIVQPSSLVANASAVIQGSTRFILYNITFMKMVAKITNTNWASVSIMAHEVGHHLNGHTLDGLGSRPDKELEADEFSGFVLRRLGASLEDAQKAMNSIASEQDGPTHPGKFKRLNAIATGWANAGQINSDPKPVKPIREITENEERPIGTARSYININDSDSDFARDGAYIHFTMFCDVENTSKFSIDLTIRFPYGYYRNCTVGERNFIVEGYIEKDVTLSPTEKLTVEAEIPALLGANANRSRCAGIDLDGIKMTNVNFSNR